jgi:hypothetical protein
MLSGRAALPREESMLAPVREHYRQMEESGKCRHYMHGINVLPSLFYLVVFLVALARTCSSTWYLSQEVLSLRPDWRNIK